MERYSILLLLVILKVSQIFAQDKQKIPRGFFKGKWGGVISGKIKLAQENEILPFYLELIGNTGDSTAQLKLNAVRFDSDLKTCDLVKKPIVVFDSQAPCGIFSKISPPVFTINFSQDFGKRVAKGMKLDPCGNYTGFNTFAAYQLAFATGFRMDLKNENIIFLSAREGALFWKGGNAKGELRRIKKCTKKDKIPLDIFLSTEYKDEAKTFPNGTEIQKIHDKLKIVTKDGCVELFIKEYFKINGLDGTKMEISVSKVLDGVIESNIYEGYIQVDIWEDDKHHQFTTKDAIVEVSGTNFTMEVSGDGATILTVLDGEVEFSDKKKRKTVVVKKNQISFVNPGGLPSEPVSIDPNQILRWWE